MPAEHDSFDRMTDTATQRAGAPRDRGAIAAHPARRVFVVGGSGSGKTTLARTIGSRAGLAVHELDFVARVGGGNGPERTAAERARLVADIVASPRWVVEGIHLGWTEPLLEAADVIVWLDHVPWAGSSRRIVRRFVAQAFAEARRQRGWRRFLRLRDYGHRLRELGAAIPETRRYHAAGASGDPSASRAAAAEALHRHQDKLIHCRTPADVERAVEFVAPAAEARDGGRDVADTG